MGQAAADGLCGTDTLGRRFWFWFCLWPCFRSAWFGFSFKPKVKGDGQECPSHIFCPCSLFQRRFEPEPRIIFGPLNQASANGVLANVLQLRFEALLRSGDVIERFFLPDRAART